MNFFGHSAVASWRSPAAAVGLGAMLPDFASMAGVRLATAREPDVASGIALHHQTDGVFHGLAPVTALMRELDERLDRRGCARGPRRAVAHIGIELLLDGVLVDTARYRAAYLAAIAHDAELDWPEPEHPVRFAGLLGRLRYFGVPDDLRRAAAITARLHRVLTPRPRLRPTGSDLVAIEAALGELQPRVAIAATTVLEQLAAQLA